MAAANGTFSIRIRRMGGDDIVIPDMTMKTSVMVLKFRIFGKYLSRYILNNNTQKKMQVNNIKLTYVTNRVKLGFIELLGGNLEDYDIDFFNPDTELELLIDAYPKDDHIKNSPQELASLLANPDYLVSIPSNTMLAREVSPHLNFRKIYILNKAFDENHSDNQKGLPCTVMYISRPISTRYQTINKTVQGIMNMTVIDVHNPDIRLSSSGDIKSSLLYDYIKDRRVAVEEPIHGGRRKKRTRRTKRKLLKKHRTRRKQRKH